MSASKGAYTYKEENLDKAFEAVGTQHDIYEISSCGVDVCIRLKANPDTYLMRVGQQGDLASWKIYYKGKYFGLIQNPRDGLMMFDYLDRFLEKYNV